MQESWGSTRAARRPPLGETWRGVGTPSETGMPGAEGKEERFAERGSGGGPHRVGRREGEARGRRRGSGGPPRRRGRGDKGGGRVPPAHQGPLRGRVGA